MEAHQKSPTIVRGFFRRATFQNSAYHNPSPAPAVLPDFLADQAGDAWLLGGHRNHRVLRGPARDFKQQLGPDRLLEFLAILDRHHEGARAPDDAVLVVPIEIVDIHGRIRRLLHHDRQAVDDDALRKRLVARADDRRAVIVGTIAGNVDDAAQALIRIFVEQRHREIDRAGYRRARGPADRGLHDLVGDGVRRFRAVDHPPGNDDLLVARRRPFEIGDRDLAVRKALQRLQEFLRDDGLRVTLALYRELIHIHRIGNIDGENQFDIDS